MKKGSSGSSGKQARQNHDFVVKRVKLLHDVAVAALLAVRESKMEPMDTDVLHFQVDSIFAAIEALQKHGWTPTSWPHGDTCDG